MAIAQVAGGGPRAFSANSGRILMAGATESGLVLRGGPWVPAHIQCMMLVARLVFLHDAAAMPSHRSALLILLFT